MKILFVANAIVGDKPGVSGGETRFIEVARGFERAKQTTHLLAAAGARHLLRQFGIKSRLHIISRSGSTSRSIFFIRFFQSLFGLPSSVKSERFDIIYATSEQSYDVIAGWRIKRRNPQAKFAVVVHWLPPSPPWKRTGSSFWNALFFWISERLGLYIAALTADILLPVSEATTSQLRAVRIPDRKFVTVECGVEYERIRKLTSKVKKKDIEAVFMKRIQRTKGIFDLIEAWKETLITLPQAKLVVIGEGIDRAAAEEKVKELGLEKRIEFTGVIYDFHEKYTLIARAKLFLLPTHEENWAIVIGEAMAAGTPVISYGLPELKAVWQDACEWVKPHDVPGFAQAITDLLSDSKKWTALQEKSLLYVKRYDWAAIAKRELEIIVNH